MLERLFKKRQARIDAVEKARKGYSSFRIVSKSIGWKIYEDEIQKKIDNIKEQMEVKDDLSGEDLKRLQLALKVWRQVQLLPKKIRDNAKGGLKDAA